MQVRLLEGEVVGNLPGLSSRENLQPRSKCTMAFQQSEVAFKVLSAEELQAWRAIPPAAASDCMNRTQVMKAAIKPITQDTVLCGQARTVTTMVGDCGPICALIDAAQPGEVIVVDAAGVEDIAVWGGVMTERPCAGGSVPR